MDRDLLTSRSTPVRSKATSQATSLLGQTVDVPAGAALISGRVSSVTFENGQPRITIETDDDRTISGISLTTVSQINSGDQ